MAKPASRPGAGFSFRIPFACQLDAVRPVIQDARELLAGHGARQEALEACELALVEACNNAILYTSDASQPIFIQLLIEGSNLEIQVIDHTPGFDWPTTLELPEPIAEHGRGLFIIQAVMDQVVYLRGNGENRLLMRKSNFFAEPNAQNPVSEQLEQTKQKLALTEQVISGMAKELWTQIVSARAEQEKVDNRLMAHELEIARQIQHSLLPKTFPPLPGFELSGFCLSARQVGGDFYDVLPLSSEVVLLVVADVMGKGVPAALFAATLRTLLRTTVQWIRRPAKLLRRVNRLMYADLSGVDMFITAQLVLVDTRVGRLVVANAGHCPLLLRDDCGQIETVSPEGMPLGIVPEAEFEEEVVPFGPASCAMLYSDGITETRNPSGELFGHQRLVHWLLQNLDRNSAAEELCREIQAELKRFQATVSPTDDQTGLILSPLTIGDKLPVPFLASTALARASRG
jgi:serine phosphatase RsbU (regulator of sigma subunit)/anti-sigma regulatory factor (Ser/Thr protein kinase)